MTKSSHRTTTPAGAVLPRLSVVYVVTLTSLGAFAPGQHCCVELPCNTSLHQHNLMISANRKEKHSLTRQCRLFAVRHRLRYDLHASSYPPFVVELFTARGFAPSPRLWSEPVPIITYRKLPTHAWLSEPLRDLHPTCCPKQLWPEPPREGFAPSSTTEASRVQRT